MKSRLPSPTGGATRHGRVAAAYPKLPAAEMADSVGQDYLDALPIAAAVVCVNADGAPYVDAANKIFWAAAAANGLEGKWLSQMDCVKSHGVDELIKRFAKGDKKSIEREIAESDAPGRRHYLARVARLKPNSLGGFQCLLTMMDRTAQIETERNLRAGMLRDSLTGLPNRLAFNEKIEQLLESGAFEEGRHAVVAIDLTRFSRINECMGALVGDELLITFARRLFSGLRAGDLLARTGGDEFSILMALENGVDDALQLADRIRAVLTAPFRLSELEIQVDCAIGIALLQDNVVLAEEVLRNAQFALKRAKRIGGAVQVYEAGEARAVRRRFSIETELRRAIEREELSVVFQPLIGLSDGAVVGFEALCRWDHEDRGAISPDEFIPVAEESGLIVPLGRLALNRALATLADWDRQEAGQLPIRVGINVSPIQIARDDFPARVSEALERHDISGARLIVELTESAIIQDPERVGAALAALKETDVKVAMDDFGTGHTSLQYLQRLPIDILKIDRSFVTDMLRNADSGAIVRAVLSLADALGMKTVAEGVEDEDVSKLLAELGCTFGQGFHYSGPMPADSALAYWRACKA